MTDNCPNLTKEINDDFEQLEQKILHWLRETDPDNESNSPLFVRFMESKMWFSMLSGLAAGL